MLLILAASAALSVALPAFAQSGPSEADTIAYIDERCSGGPLNNTFDIDGDIVSFATSYRSQVWSTRFNLRALNLAPGASNLSESMDEGRTHVNLACLTNISEVTCGSHTYPDGRTVRFAAYALTCEEGDRVLNALRHLQTLRGGPMSGGDPFA